MSPGSRYRTRIVLGFILLVVLILSFLYNIIPAIGSLIIKWHTKEARPRRPQPRPTIQEKLPDGLPSSSSSVQSYLYESTSSIKSLFSSIQQSHTDFISVNSKPSSPMYLISCVKDGQLLLRMIQSGHQRLSVVK